MTYPADQLRPFIRNGKARPLTSADYAYISGTSRTSAQVFLWRMARAGLLTCEDQPKNNINVYEITDAGLDCLTGIPGIATVTPRKLADARLVAVAKHAFGGRVDVRPLLPEYEEGIGDMMRREVPRQFRSLAHLRVVKANPEVAA